jgi:hypothetical protein
MHRKAIPLNKNENMTLSFFPSITIDNLSMCFFDAPVKYSWKNGRSAGFVLGLLTDNLLSMTKENVT